MNGPTEDDEALLGRFREWLIDARAEADGHLPAESDDGSEVGLYRLVEEFTALRHEVKLETKSARGLQDQVETLLPALHRAIDEFRSIGPKEEQAVRAAARPLAESIADLDEALDRGRVEIEKARDRSRTESAALAGSITAELDETFRVQSWFRRRSLRAYHERARDLVGRLIGEARPETFDALLEGYGLIQSRLKRAMESTQVRRMACVGLPVDPDRMTVIEVVDAPDQAPGTVVDEVRRGYTWRGRVLRFAEVRAVRGRPIELEQEATAEPEIETEEKAWN